jgi:hypothetical protein
MNSSMVPKKICSQLTPASKKPGYNLINERLGLIQAFPLVGQPHLHSLRRI